MRFSIRRYHVLIAVCASILIARTVPAPASKGLRPEIIPKIAVPPTLTAELPLPKATVKMLPETPLPMKHISLTFDDGPHPAYTERLLKVLKQARVHATFFVVGKQAELHPELLKMISDDGHEIANHTYSHRNMRTLSPSDICEELEKTEKIVESVTGKKMRYFRPPGGQYNSQVVAAAKDRGYEMVLWSIFPQDHTNPASELIRSRVLTGAKNDGIVLLHSGIENTLQTLPDLIKTLKRKGYAFETVTGLRPDSHFQHLARK